MNFLLLENVNALLDDHQIERCLDERTQYLSAACEFESTETHKFLTGESSLPHGSIKKLARLFEVDVKWLIGKD